MFRKIYNILVVVVAAIKTLPGLNKVKKMNDESQYNEKKELTYKVTSRFGDDIVKGSKAIVTVNGLDKDIYGKPILFVSNHQSNYDIPILLGVVPRQIGFISKIELKKMPIAGEWITEMNGVFMDRENPRQSLEAIKEGSQKLQAGHSLIIFPEGTRSKGPIVNDFKGGSLALAKKANVPIVPIVIDGTYKIGKEKRPKIKITFLNPIYLEKNANLNLVAASIKNNIEQVLEDNKKYVKKINY
jgi:1-acyl-sn-glycerol-3-phosphate acyltransferase